MAEPTMYGIYLRPLFAAVVSRLNLTEDAMKDGPKDGNEGADQAPKVDHQTQAAWIAALNKISAWPPRHVQATAQPPVLRPLEELSLSNEFCFSCDSSVLTSLDKRLHPEDARFAEFAIGRWAKGVVELARKTDSSPKRGNWAVVTPTHQVNIDWGYFRHPSTGVDVVIVKSPRFTKRPFTWSMMSYRFQRALKEHKWTLIYLAVFLGALNLLIAQLGVTAGLWKGVWEWLAYGAGTLATFSVTTSET